MVAGVWLRPQFLTTATVAAEGCWLGAEGGRGRRQHCWAACGSLWFFVTSWRKAEKEEKRIQKFYCYTRKITTACRGSSRGTDKGRRRPRWRLQGVAFWLRFRFRQKSKLKSKSRHIEGDYPAQSQRRKQQDEPNRKKKIKKIKKEKLYKNQPEPPDGRTRTRTG